jgi:hypothetical protein
MPPELLPELVLERLSEGERALVERARQAEAPAAPPTDCVNALKRLRVDRERADVQDQIDRLQAGARLDDGALARLWAQKQALVRRLEELKG